MRRAVVYARRGFGRVFLDRYRLIDAFHRQRIPLVALLFGPPLPGGTGVAMQLASRLNMPHVVHVDLMADVLRASGDRLSPREFPSAGRHRGEAGVLRDVRA